MIIKRYSLLIFIILLTSCKTREEHDSQRSKLPLVWTTYREIKSLDEDFRDLKNHGVGLVNMSARNAEEAKEKLQIARKHGMKYNINLPEITESINQVKREGFHPVPALMLGGVYNGKSIDRHLFSFSPKQHAIIIETPVYNESYAYNVSHKTKDGTIVKTKVGHYFPDMPHPVKAEIVVPIKLFDGKQHLKIINAEIEEAPAGTKPNIDSVENDSLITEDIKERKLYQLKFDLRGLDDALLDKVGIAVYWPYQGSRKYWIFAGGNVSASAQSTQLALRSLVKKNLSVWKEANGGKFPSDVVVAGRLGDECFYITGHIHSNAPSVSYPLWDFSKASIDAFHLKAGDTEYPRTWGYPEIYGENAYGYWLYNLHEQVANLVDIAGKEAKKIAPELKIFRNTTRMGIFSLSNNFDGTGQEMLARKLDIIHLDPYPVTESGYGAAIPRDMSYCAGLARRYNKPLIPWMQAHTYSKLKHVTPDDIDKMTNEQWSQGIDGLVWLGYSSSYTFPNVRSDSWEKAGQFHEKLRNEIPPKPKAKMAVLRSYNKMASLSIIDDNKIINPEDWMLQQFLEVWAVKLRKPYDVFEIPPELSETEKIKLEKELNSYDFIVSTLPWEGALHIENMNAGNIIEGNSSSIYQKMFEKKILELNWQ